MAVPSADDGLCALGLKSKQLPANFERQRAIRRDDDESLTSGLCSGGCQGRYYMSREGKCAPLYCHCISIKSLCCEATFSMLETRCIP